MGNAETTPQGSFDPTQFSQWMVKNQYHLLRELVHQQRGSQASLVRDLQKIWTGPQGGGGSPQLPMGKPSWAPLTKLTAEDDVEAFLETFERTAEADQWPRDQWAYLVGPYLTGPTQVAVKALTKDDATNYKVVKAAVLDRYEINPETARQKFRSVTWGPSMRPQELVATLRDAALRWLRPTMEDGRRIIEAVVLEQLLLIMPPRARHWVACSKPPDLKLATTLWDNFLAAEAPEKREGPCLGSGTQGPRTGGPLYPPQGGGDKTGRARSAGPGPAGVRPWLPFPPRPSTVTRGGETEAQKGVALAYHLRRGVPASNVASGGISKRNVHSWSVT